jgi:hypothetical protein
MHRSRGVEEQEVPGLALAQRAAGGSLGVEVHRNVVATRWFLVKAVTTRRRNQTVSSSAQFVSQEGEPRAHLISGAMSGIVVAG